MARAQAWSGEPRVVLGEPPLRQALGRELERRGVALVEVPAPAEPPAPDRSGLERARLAFERLEVGRALAEVEAWLAAVDAGRLATSREDLREGLLLRARIELALGRDPTGSLTRARAIDPSYELDPVLHQPSLLEVWARLSLPAPVQVRFEGPPGLRVEVDGQPVGTTARVVPGPHLVVFEAPGHKAWRGRRDLRARVGVSLEPDPTAALRDAVALTSEVRRAALALGAVPLLIRREGRRVVAVDGGGLGRVTVRVSEGELVEAVARRVATALLALRRSSEGAAQPAAPQRGAQARRRRWTWAIVAATGIAAAAAGVGVALRRGEGWEARYRP